MEYLSLLNDFKMSIDTFLNNELKIELKFFECFLILFYYMLIRLSCNLIIANDLNNSFINVEKKINDLSLQLQRKKVVEFKENNDETSSDEEKEEEDLTLNTSEDDEEYEYEYSDYEEEEEGEYEEEKIEKKYEKINLEFGDLMKFLSSFTKEKLKSIYNYYEETYYVNLNDEHFLEKLIYHINLNRKNYKNFYHFKNAHKLKLYWDNTKEFWEIYNQFEKLISKKL